MHVPAAAGDLDEADAVLDQATSEETALAELALAVACLRLGRLGSEVEGLEVRALHELEGRFVEFVVRLDALVRRLTAETCIKFGEQASALGHDSFGDWALGVHEAIGRIENRQRRVSRREPTVTMVRRAIDGNGGWQGLVAGAEEVLSPSPEGRVLDGAALLEAGAHEVGRRGMDADLGSHGADNGDPVADLGRLREIGSQLHVALSGDNRAGALGGARLRIEGVDVRHASVELQEDHALGLTETRQTGVRRLHGSRRFGGLGDPGEEREDAQAERDLGALLDEATTVLGITEEIGGMEDAHWTKRNSRVLARTQARSVRARPSASDLLAAVSSLAVGLRER